MFRALAAFIYRRRRWTLAASTLFLAASIALVSRGGRLTGASFGDGEAQQTERLVEQVLGHPTDTTFVVVFHSPRVDARGSAREQDLDPRERPFRDAMNAALAPLANHPDVLSVVTPDDAPFALAPDMVNGQASSAIVLVTLKGNFQEALLRYPVVRAQLRSATFAITCTGKLPFMDDFGRVLAHDVVRAELISLPLVLLVLLLVFRTVVAAALPVGVGALAVVGAIAVVLGLSVVMDIAEYAVNICSLIGLGVAIDYSLFTVSRYREELAAGHDYPEALARALEGAGRVVCFSGLVLGTGLGGLLFFRGSFLWAMGVGGIVVVALAVVFALTFLPALLAVLGPKIHAWALPIPRFGPSAGFWHRAASWVMRRPVSILVPTLALLALIGSPFLRLEMTEADVRVLGLDVEARRGFEILKRDFPEFGANRVVMAVRFPSSPALTSERIGALFDLSERIAQMPHVSKVESIVSGEGLAKEFYQTALIDPPELFKAQIDSGKKLTVGQRVVLLYALLDSAADTEASRHVIRMLRSQRAILDGTLSVGGQTASDMDATEFVREKVPAAIGFVVATSLVILFLLLGSLVLPIKAIVMNFVSVAGSFGALVWIFQEGHLGIAEPRPVEHALPVLLFCVLFGLSMDYEVLMLSRIKESYERTHDNTLAVAEGLEKTAGIITSAAAIMIVVFSAFALTKVVLLRAVGLGMALAVLIDATLVRLLLVPATMRLFGDWNWWAPRLLSRLRAALGLH
jgi:putative drug exporter of the RND superfamily